VVNRLKNNIVIEIPMANKENGQKILLLPVAIIGAGKSTLARILCKLSPVSFGHIQSDSMPRTNRATHFINAVLESFETNQVVYADKNNHLFIHRQRLVQTFRKKYANGIVIALNWNLEDYEQQRDWNSVRIVC
jgi:tRNA ligase